MELVASGLFPGFTTVALPHYEMGSCASRQLLELMASPSGKARQVRQSGQLIRRGSVAPPPVGNRGIASAGVKG